MYASSCRFSISVKRTPRHRALARQSVPNTSFRQLFSSKKRGITLLRRRSSTNDPSHRLVVRINLLVKARQLQVSQRRLQILLQARHGAGQIRLVLLDHFFTTLHAAGVIGRITHILEQPLDGLVHLLRHLLQHVLHLVEPAADSLALRPHRLHRLDQSRRPVGGDRQRHRQIA